MGKLIHEELSRRIIGAAMDVLNEMKPGPKVVASFNEAHVAQMVGYIAITGLELALLLNFKSSRLEWKRVVRQKKPDSNPPDLDV
jgi:hypothetical protein